MPASEETLSLDEAALYLGMTSASFRALAQCSKAHLPSEGRILNGYGISKPDLEAFRDSYLPRFKTWDSRTGLLREFGEHLRARTGFIMEEQPCEIDGCEILAEFQCANSDCRPGASPRKVCGHHTEFLRDLSGRRLCAVCVVRWLQDELPEKLAAGGTRSRLEREYLHGQTR